MSTPRLVPVPLSIIRQIQDTVCQALDCVNGEQPEDCTVEEARQDTILKLKEADHLLQGANAFSSLMQEYVLAPVNPTAKMIKAAADYHANGKWTVADDSFFGGHYKAMLLAAPVLNSEDIQRYTVSQEDAA